MPVGEVCVRQVVHAGRETTVNEAAQLMRQFHVGNLVVVDEDGGRKVPVGIVTDRDIVLSVVAPKLDPSVITLGDLLSADLVTAPEGTGITDCLHRMRSKGIRRMPIVDGRGALVGIISVDDIIELLAAEMNELSLLIAREQGKEVRTRR